MRLISVELKKKSTYITNKAVNRECMKRKDFSTQPNRAKGIGEKAIGNIKLDNR